MEGFELDSNEPAPPPYSQEELDSKVELARQVSIHDAQAGSHPHAPAQFSPPQESQQYAPPSAPTTHPIPSPPPASRNNRVRRPLPIPNALSSMAIPPPPPLVPVLNQFHHSAEPYPHPATRPTAKERPSWYAEAGLEAPSGSSSSSQAAQSSSSTTDHPRAQTHSLDQVPPALPDDERDSPLGHELPAFEPVGPSLDGPAYSISDNASDTTEGSPQETESTPPSPVRYSPVPHRPEPRNRLMSQATPAPRSRSPYSMRNSAFISPPSNAPPAAGYNPRPDQISRPSGATRVFNPSAFYK